MVSKKDRDDYEKGRRYDEANVFEQMFIDMFEGEPSEAEKKGRRGEQLDEDKSDCFISSACARARGLPDDCLDLQMLRAFRDHYVRPLPEGEALIAEYYRLAPEVASRINAREDSVAVYSELYDTLVSRTVELIRVGRHRDALSWLVDRCTRLKREYVQDRAT